MPQYCIEFGCEKQASYGYPGTQKRITCKKHHLYGMVSVKEHKKCKCGKFTVDNGLCISCNNLNQGIVRNDGENILKNYLKERFPELCLKTEFYLLIYKTDFLLELEELFIVIEHDQDQHKGKRYPPKREVKREQEIFEKLSKKKRTVLIRFNPSNFTVNDTKVEVPLEDKFDMLGEFIEKCISDQTKSGIFRLFYDE